MNQESYDDAVCGEALVKLMEDFPISERECALAARYTVIRPCIVEGVPDAHIAWFVVDQQSFCIAPIYDDTAEEAAWTCWQFSVALRRLIDQQGAAALQAEVERLRSLFLAARESLWLLSLHIDDWGDDFNYISQGKAWHDAETARLLKAAQAAGLRNEKDKAMDTPEFLAFCGTEEHYYPIRKPFVQAGWRYATDRAVMVRKIAPGEPDTEEVVKCRFLRDCASYFADFPECHQALPAMPEKDVAQCKQCRGTGDCICNCGDEHPCQACDGSGVDASARQGFDEPYEIKVRNLAHIRDLPGARCCRIKNRLFFTADGGIQGVTVLYEKEGD